jgi:hypothetical protein
MHRWLTIQAQVNKFCSCYEAIERRNQNGHTIQDKVCIMCLIVYHNLFYLKLVYKLMPCTDFRSIQVVHRTRQGQKKTSLLCLVGTY